MEQAHFSTDRTPFPTMVVEEAWANRFLVLDLPFRCPYCGRSKSMKTQDRHGTHLGPRGAQYSPVFLMSNVLMNSMSDSAASSGVTAIVLGKSKSLLYSDR